MSSHWCITSEAIYVMKKSCKKHEFDKRLTKTVAFAASSCQRCLKKTGPRCIEGCILNITKDTASSLEQCLLTVPGRGNNIPVPLVTGFWWIVRIGCCMIDDLLGTFKITLIQSFFGVEHVGCGAYRGINEITSISFNARTMEFNVV